MTEALATVRFPEQLAALLERVLSLSTPESSMSHQVVAIRFLFVGALPSGESLRIRASVWIRGGAVVPMRLYDYWI